MHRITGPSHCQRSVVVLATILALTLLAFTQTSGAIIAADLAVVIIGGLLTSTLLTLIVVPVVFKLIGCWQQLHAANQARRAATPTPAAAE